MEIRIGSRETQTRRLASAAFRCAYRRKKMTPQYRKLDDGLATYLAALALAARAKAETSQGYELAFDKALTRLRKPNQKKDDPSTYASRADRIVNIAKAAGIVAGNIIDDGGII